MRSRWLFALGFCLLWESAFAAGNRTLRFAPGPTAASIPVNVAKPEIVGLDTVGSTLGYKSGVWTGSGLTLTRNWHYVGGSSLGTGSTYGPLASGEIGKAIELDETATNAAGTVTVTSYWIGPVEASLPAAPYPLETCVDTSTVPPTTTSCSSDPTILPGPPTHFLQNGHAVFPGCIVPPVAPTYTASGDTHVWYFDPVGGTTQTAGATGHTRATAFKDIGALFAPTVAIPGYPAGGLFGFGKTIAPGDTIYIEPGDSTHPVGSIATTAGSYSTSDGTNAGTVAFTWIMGDPATTGPTSRPVLNQISLTNNGYTGFIFGRNLGVEPAVQNAPFISAVSFSSNNASYTTNPVHDIYVEDIAVSSQPGGANIPFVNFHYPMTGGTSTGDIQTGSPMYGPGGGQNPVPLPGVIMSTGASTFTTTGAANVGWYVFSPGSFPGGGAIPAVAPAGIPPGTVIKSVTGTGTFTVTIGPCDPVADRDTGCPTTNFPGINSGAASNVPQCDPLTVQSGISSGGCGGGTVTAWAGATRTISGETLLTTSNIVIPPAGAFASSDWGLSFQTAFTTGGSLNTAGSLNPAAPTLYQGVSCLSFKDNAAMGVSSGYSTRNSTNSVFYNNHVKFFAADGYDEYSNHRIWFINNYAGDPTQSWNHMDAFQIASGGGGLYYNFGNAYVDNEAVQYIDATNYFPAVTQGIDNTDNYQWGAYIADNVVNVGSNALLLIGKYSVVVHNSVVNGSLTVGVTTKGGYPAVATVAPLGHMIANNVASGVSRSSTVPAYCDPTIGDQDIVRTNISIPFLDTPTIGTRHSSIYCTTAKATGTFSYLKTAGSFVVGRLYTIVSVGTTDFTLVGASSNTVGVVFTATGVGTGTGTAAINPLAGETIVTNGTTWTFVASGATGNQINIGANLAATTLAAVQALLASGDTNTATMTYGNNSTSIVATAKVVGVAGHALTIAASGTSATVSGATLANGIVGLFNSVVGSFPPVTGASPLVPNGLSLWSASDPQTQNTPNFPLFTGYQPGANPVYPQRGFGLTAGLYLMPCPQLSILPFACATNGVGTLNPRPNLSYSGTNQVISGNVVAFSQLPAGLADGTFFVVSATSAGQLGVWESCGTTVTCVGNIITNSGSKWMMLTDAYFAPGLQGAGTNLGAQMPIADHDGKAWSSPPSIGAYR